MPEDLDAGELGWSLECALLKTFPPMSNVGPSLGSTRFVESNLFEHPSTTTSLHILITASPHKKLEIALFKLLGNHMLKNANENIDAIIDTSFYFPYCSNKHILCYFQI